MQGYYKTVEKKCGLRQSYLECIPFLSIDPQIDSHVIDEMGFAPKMAALMISTKLDGLSIFKEAARS